MKRPLKIRTVADLDRTARSLALHFKTRTVVVVGSQGILVGWPGAPVTMCMSPKIDAYPANARAWEAAQDDDLAEASEENSVFFGEGSLFHTAHGFYIGGVDRTARLPPSWPSRAVVREVRGHGTATVTVVAPVMDEGRSVSIRAWNEVAGLYDVLDNPLGPAVVAQDGTSAFLIDGKALPREMWDTHPRVRAARRGDLSGYPRPN